VRALVRRSERCGYSCGETIDRRSRPVVPIDEKTLSSFYLTFKGNEEFYVKHQAPFIQDSEGKTKASWCGFAKKDGAFISVTNALYLEHLNGGDGLAIAPLSDTDTQRYVCWHAAIDIDVNNVVFTHLVKRMYALGFKFIATLSKSGGLHIYFLFTDPELGESVIEVLAKIIEVLGLNRLYVSGKRKSKVEIFPKQAVYTPGDTNANCLLLPFYNAANKSTQNMLTGDGLLIPITKAFRTIEGMFTSVKVMQDTLAKLPYRDAPFCIQMVLLTGALSESDGRNNFSQLSPDV
jgi:hypothetical protein